MIRTRSKDVSQRESVYKLKKQTSINSTSKRASTEKIKPNYKSKQNLSYPETKKLQGLKLPKILYLKRVWIYYQKKMKELTRLKFFSRKCERNSIELPILPQ